MLFGNLTADSPQTKSCMHVWNVPQMSFSCIYSTSNKIVVEIFKFIHNRKEILGRLMPKALQSKYPPEFKTFFNSVGSLMAKK